MNVYLATEPCPMCGAAADRPHQTREAAGARAIGELIDQVTPHCWEPQPATKISRKERG
ncbi:hypothetical protein AB0J43_02025 [Nonomuraea fuscirosea]